MPLGHDPIYTGSQIVGCTTSAAFGYRVGKPVALAHVNLDHVGRQSIELDVAGDRFSAKLQTAAAFDPSGEHMKRS